MDGGLIAVIKKKGRNTDHWIFLKGKTCCVILSYLYVILTLELEVKEVGWLCMLIFSLEKDKTPTA